jgi:hypothetical protein
MAKVRVELPVLLYADVEVPDGLTNGALKEAAKGVLQEIFGEVEDERGFDTKVPLANSKIYVSDHFFADSYGKFDVVDFVEEEERSPFEGSPRC